MLSKIANLWQDNHGSALTICGLLVALIMSIAWRYDLVPEVGPPSNVIPTLTGQRPIVKPNILVATIRSQEAREGKLILQIVGPPAAENEPLEPVYSRQVALQEGVAEFVVTELSLGTYAAFAFLDLDGNEVLNIDDAGLPAEPFGFARSVGSAEPKKLGDGVFELSGEPVFIKIQLRVPVTSRTPSKAGT